MKYKIVEVSFDKSEECCVCDAPAAKAYRVEIGGLLVGEAEVACAKHAGVARGLLAQVVKEMF